MKSKLFGYAAVACLAATVFLIASLVFHNDVDIIMLLTAICTPVGIAFATVAVIISTNEKVEI